MKIKTIDLKDHRDSSDGWYEINLYPERSFERTVDVILYGSESYGNFHYHYLFQYYNARNIKVRVHAAYNLFPIASLLGHTIILQKPLLADSWLKQCLSRKSTYEFDRKYSWEKYGVTHWEDGGSNEGGLKNMRWLNDVDIWTKGSKYYVAKTVGIYGHFELLTLFNSIKDKTMFIDKRALDIFSEEGSHFPQNLLWIEYSGRRGPMANIMELIKSYSNTPIFLSSKSRFGGNGFLEKVVYENEGHKYFLTYQMLCSIYNNVKFAAVGGSASLFSITPFINCAIMLDSGHNVSHQTGFFKSLFNKAIFNEDTYCFPCELKMDSAKHSYDALSKNRTEFIKTVMRGLTSERGNANLSSLIIQ